ncbi:alpha-ketoglutarate-dependent dioxygenase AlkB family protein [Cochlodiniinecator piscidefendens]|uniref:alpha-ketoglutarate-dependent dioxygenase AlkB family protein n=1 Tax=Cochlodiniinecator piscidefendens TaxID=2715756 RepID=UPI0014079E41|nr:alpha-ketoglutarate-dependent dioxygenase AlkB [Cochlodiniinecator piscidefendens]
MKPTLMVRNASVFKGCLNAGQQSDLVSELREIARIAPPFSPQTPYGKPMSVKLTSAGDFGWLSDAHGYRYSETHPNGARWPEIPQSLLSLWFLLTGVSRAPNSCLINFYGEGAKMGMHQDRDEKCFDWPVLSISLGDEALFRIGGATRSGSTESLWLSSGDVVVLGDEARLAYHGIDRIRFGSSGLLPKGGRVNVTLRVVD